MPAARGTVPPAYAACGVGLFVAVFVLADAGLGLAWPPPQGGTGLPTGLATELPDLVLRLCMPVHLFVSLYDGRFRRLRVATWLLLILGYAGSVAMGFLAYVLPWGQINFFVAARLAAIWPVAGDALGPWLAGGGLALLAPTVGLAILALDMAVLHVGTWRGPPGPEPRLGGWRPARVALWVIGGAIAAALLAGVALRYGASPVPPAPAAPDDLLTPAAIVPAWHLLPFYALLRAVPDKLGGVGLMFAAVLLPAIWPWARADQVRIGPRRRVFQALCLMLLGAWLVLGWAGAQPPDGAALAASRLAAGCVGLFFLAVPLLGRRTRIHSERNPP